VTVRTEHDEIFRLIRTALAPWFDVVDLKMVMGLFAPFALLTGAVEEEFVFSFSG